MTNQTKTPGAMVSSTPAQKLWQLQIFLDAAGLHEQSKLAFDAIQQLEVQSEQPPAVGGEPEVVHQYLSKGECARWQSLDESQLVEAAQQGFTTRQLIDRDSVAPMLAELDALRKILAATRDARDAAQYRVAELEAAQGEAVAWMNDATGDATTNPVVVMDWDDEKEPVISLYRQSQPATAKVVLPERKREATEDSDIMLDCQNEGWNACLDEVAKLNGGS